jgi:dCMP deaminase
MADCGCLGSERCSSKCCGLSHEGTSCDKCGIKITPYERKLMGGEKIAEIESKKEEITKWYVCCSCSFKHEGTGTSIAEAYINADRNCKIRNKPRKSWDEYFFDLARMVATRSTCPRLSVGSVLVKDKKIISTGYNGSKSGEPHCIDVGCDLEIDPWGRKSHCKRTIHSEVNAYLNCDVNPLGATIYVTHRPCASCRDKLRQLEIEIKYEKEYP